MINGAAVKDATTATYVSNKLANNDVVTCSVTSNTACTPAVSGQVVFTVSGASATAYGVSTGEVSVVPNPNKGTFAIKGFLGTANDQDVSLEITNMLGQVVYKSSAVAHGGLLDEKVSGTGALANGMYLLNMRSDSMTKEFHIVIEQ